MVGKSERLTVLSEAEQVALYGLPDFDDEQRLDYLSLSESELVLANSRPSLCVAQFLVRDDTLSELAALKQDAKDFGWRQMARKREKPARLDPLYRIAKTLLPEMAVSQQNLLYYASLANFYT